ncbi:MogA/MoaB family molybdenum cofactor biosynthesis protein [Yimella sp. cx-51]|nr:MogA/MoaB family molybdenum cofactor biosynthesis protein [Yimella sp. cx-51]QTH39488.1 MogA/MoaB family molybdenum cofactor biosynthesis protein [Yimella sp. cx-51]
MGWSRVRSAVVITCSTRAASGVYSDRSGPILVEALREWGFATGDPVLVADGDAVGHALRTALQAEPALILTTGGTGLNPTDSTPEQTAPLLDRQIPGIPEALRAPGVAAGIPGAMLSRGLAGVAGTTLVINLPGSTGGVRDALDVLRPVLDHAIDQLHGGDHRA